MTGTSSDEDSERDVGSDVNWKAHSRYRLGINKRNPDTVTHGNQIRPKKRKYSMSRRLRALPRPNISFMRTTWIKWLEELSDYDLSNINCCTQMQCFREAHIPFLRDRMKHFLTAPNTRRRAGLKDMLTSDGSFCFNGQTVCSTFLLNAFRFSRDLQISVKSTIPAHMTPSTVSVSSVPQPQNTFDIQPAQDMAFYDIQEGSTPFDSEGQSISGSGCTLMHSFKSDSVVLFLQRISDATADKMPDTGESHLPFFEKTELYSIFQREFKIMYPTDSVPTYSYFTSIWKSSCSFIKVRKTSRFSKCSTCERLRAALQDATTQGLPTVDILKEKSAHHDFISRERREYRRKAELAALHPDEYISLVVDGADQSKFCIPHFVTKVKEQRGHGIGIHLVGLLRHGVPHRLRLLTMTENHSTGANHIIEAIHRQINEFQEEDFLPRKLFLQFDNCWRENKNRYLMSYLESLLIWNVFDIIEVGFLPVGHTHSDIDQTFSTTSRRLSTHDAITLSDMHSELSKCYNEKTIVSHMKEVVNWSGLCDKSKCLNSVQNISLYRFFRFTRINSNSGANSNSLARTLCQVRSSVDDSWKDIQTSVSNIPSCFLKTVPNLQSVPPEKLTAPSDLDAVTSRIASEEGRIGISSKLRSLNKLKEDVYRNRSVMFHWNLSNIVECTRTGEDSEDSFENLNTNGLDSAKLSEPPQNYDYNVDSFVIVKAPSTEDSTHVGFWVGKVLDVHRGSSRTINVLNVLWYQFYSGDQYTGKYKPWVIRDNKKSTEWRDNISTETVIVTLEKLNADKTLPKSISRSLRDGGLY